VSLRLCVLHVSSLWANETHWELLRNWDSQNIINSAESEKEHTKSDKNKYRVEMTVLCWDRGPWSYLITSCSLQSVTVFAGVPAMNCSLLWCWVPILHVTLMHPFVSKQMHSVTSVTEHIFSIWSLHCHFYSNSPIRFKKLLFYCQPFKLKVQDSSWHSRLCLLLPCPICGWTLPPLICHWTH